MPKELGVTEAVYYPVLAKDLEKKMKMLKILSRQFAEISQN